MADLTGNDFMEARSTFRWRIIPGYFLFISGGLLCVLWVLMLIIFLIRPSLLDEEMRGTFQEGSGIALLAVCGLLWFVTGRLILKGRWGWMLVTLAVGYVCGGSGGFLASIGSSPTH